MDPGRYGVQQGWDNNSALEGYGAAHDPNFRVGSSYDDRGLINDRYSGENIYQRNAYPRDVLERDNYAPAPSAAGFWPNSRKRSHEEEYPLERDSRRYEKPYSDNYNDVDTYRDREASSLEAHDKHRDGYRSVDNYRDHGYDRPTRVGGRNRDDYRDDHEHGNRNPHQHREVSRERDHGYGRHSFDSDYDRSIQREGPSRRRDYRDREHDKRTSSRERDHSPRGRYRQSHSRSRSRSHSPSRSRSYGRDDHLRSRSPHGRSRSRSYREDSYDDGWHERGDRQRDRDERRHREAYAVAPSATVVVKGLSQKTTEEDLYQILAEWGPLRHVRVIKERLSGLSRGFAFIDFPSVGAAKAMMDRIGEDGLVVDGRKIFFEYSSKPTGSGGAFTQESSVKSGHGNHKSMIVPSDWMCIICGCVNFARRTSCFQCNEPRGDDAPAADMISSSQATLGRRGLEAGPTYVLVVRGLDENADEEMLRYEFSKHAPIKDLRLVRDKFTHVSRGFAFVHFHSVEEATKALEATNGTALEKNGQILRVAYAKSVLGPGSGAPASSQSSSLAAAAIEAAAFSQQYDSVGWAPKEYNPEGKEADGSGQGQGDGSHSVQKDGSAPQSGFVWDEASGYYYDASSGFYYDGNTGLYYDGNNAIWYSFDHQTQQYIPCNNQSESKQSEPSKRSDTSTNRKVVISAPAATITSSEKTSLPVAVQAAAAAAIAAEKKEKEKMKEIKLASKSSILANKKKMNNVLTMWKQRSHEGGQATRIALDETTQLSTQSTEDKTFAVVSQSNKIRPKAELTANRDLNAPSSTLQSVTSDSTPQPKTISGNTTGGTLMGVIRGGSGRGVVKSTETSYSASSAGASSTLGGTVDIPAATTPFKTDVSALGVYSTSSAAVSGKRRFSETPLSSASASNHREQPPHSGYRDRAAERRTLYGSSSSADDSSDLPQANSNRESGSKKDSMPFPPGVGGGRAPGDSSSNAGPSYDIITADKAIDESNVGNRMLRNMGWQEGLGLGKDGSGMVEPVQAQAVDSRAGLGSQQKKKATDPSLEVQAGDSYRTLIHKKALARFRDM